MRDAVETVFLDWKEQLAQDEQERVHYQDYDSGLQTVFVRRHEGFDRLELSSLERLLQRDVDASILVSSVTEG